MRPVQVPITVTISRPRVRSLVDIPGQGRQRVKMNNANKSAAPNESGSILTSSES